MSESLRRATVTLSVVLITAAVTFAPANRAELRAQTPSGSLDSRYWKLTGNSGTSPSTNFLGTADNQPLILKVNGTRAGVWQAAALVILALGIGLAGGRCRRQWEAFPVELTDSGVVIPTLLVP